MSIASSPQPTPRRLSGKTAFITGGGKGIGRAIALRFAREGANVALVQRDSATAHQTADEITAAGGAAIALGDTDVSQPDHVQRAVAASVERFGRIDILINNASIAGYSGSFLDVPLEVWQNILNVNLTGMFLCGQAVARQMVANGIAGRIINVGSINSFAAEKDAAAYVASKGGILSLTHAMAVDLAPHGILVNCLAPGPVTVERNEALFNGPLHAPIARSVPLGRPGTADEVAAAAVFLASDDASYVTGASLLVDGGTLAYLRFD
jgi:NAD(P)-dependent dehydrogenase (short-subunit alcohol dehydrogenase family)